MTRRTSGAARPGGSWRGSSELRLRVGLIVLAMVVSVLGVRLVQLQGLDPRAYAARADAEGMDTVPLPATRGSITDRNGVPLAQSVSGLMIVADPTRTDGKVVKKEKEIELAGWDYPSHLAGLLF